MFPYPWEVLGASNAHFELLYVEEGRNDYIWTLDKWLERFRAQRSYIVESFGGDEVYRKYETLLRRVIAGFARRWMTLLRFVFERR